MRTIGSQRLPSEEMRTIGSQILPTTERQVRPLTKLSPSSQIEAWQESVKAIAERCHRLIGVEELDPTARKVLESLGKRTFLTEVEEILLSSLESYYF